VGTAGLCLLLLTALTAACSSSDDSDDGGFCAVWNGKLRQCGLLGGGRTSCVNYNDAAERCEIACTSKAPCNEFVDYTCTAGDVSAFNDCMAKCIGLEPVTCKDGTVLSGFSRCNGTAECPGGDDSDEMSCKVTGFKCRGVMQFVDLARVCDQHRDCLDGSDEHAGCKTAFSCKVGGTTTEINAASVCDSVAQCDDMSDEPIECAPFACP